MKELRCDNNKLFGRLTPDGLLEVKCKLCSKKTGLPVFHYFRPITGELIKTEEYAEPVISTRAPDAIHSKRRK